MIKKKKKKHDMFMILQKFANMSEYISRSVEFYQ